MSEKLQNASNSPTQSKTMRYGMALLTFAAIVCAQNLCFMIDNQMI
ncbi:hypothetical protein O5O45_14885 [Hahella aquimaris]|nr:hypothetical protein [Hahella sp. HNIBRBA332]WLQ17204.1 hypothetical protein O5O45_14885 [Hahella sp. HNIBRBA332]